MHVYNSVTLDILEIKFKNNVEIHVNNVKLNVAHAQAFQYVLPVILAFIYLIKHVLPVAKQDIIQIKMVILVVEFVHNVIQAVAIAHQPHHVKAASMDYFYMIMYVVNHVHLDISKIVLQ